jgi:hypothetical protein
VWRQARAGPEPADHQLRDVPPAFVTPAIRAFALAKAPSSLGPRRLRCGSGRIVRGDRIVSIDAFAIENDWDVQTRRAASGATSLRFVVEREAQRRGRAHHEPGCYQPFLAFSASWNAFASRERSIVLPELVRAAKTDDELAMIGHELRHVVLAHDSSAPRAERMPTTSEPTPPPSPATIPQRAPGSGRRGSHEGELADQPSTHPSAPREHRRRRAVDEIGAARGRIAARPEDYDDSTSRSASPWTPARCMRAAPRFARDRDLGSQAETQLAASAAFGALFASYDRVLTISERLRVANTATCADHTGGYLGWLVLRP